MSQTPEPQIHGATAKLFPGVRLPLVLVRKLTVCVENVHHSFLPALDVYGLLSCRECFHLSYEACSVVKAASLLLIALPL